MHPTSPILFVLVVFAGDLRGDFCGDFSKAFLDVACLETFVDALGILLWAL